MTSSAGRTQFGRQSGESVISSRAKTGIVIGWVIAIKTLLFVIGVKSYPMLWDKYAPIPNRWFELWDQWDFGHYQKIAEFGYEARDGSLAFDPLFPCLLRLSLTSVEVILLPGLSSPESLRLLRRYCCAGWYNSIMTAR